MKRAIDILMEKNREMITVTPETTLFEAVQIMAKNNIGAIVVMENEEVVGIWTERDLLLQSAEEGFDLKKALIKDYMSRDLKTAPASEPIYKLQDMISGLYIRHIFISCEGKIIGLLSAGDVGRACLIERAREMNSISWEYYENWRWEKKRR